MIPYVLFGHAGSRSQSTQVRGEKKEKRAPTGPMQPWSREEETKLIRNTADGFLHHNLKQKTAKLSPSDSLNIR